MSRQTGSHTRLVLARHGETVWHAENRYAGGSSDIDLTERGVAQARAMAHWAGARSFDALVVSPVRRAIETATPVGTALALEPEILEDLREIDFGIAEGRTMEEMLALDADMVYGFRRDPVAHPFPESESAEQAALRAAGCLREVARRHQGGRVFVVAHNTLLRLALCHLLDIPVARYRHVFPRLETGALTEVALAADPAEPAGLLMLNAPPLEPS